VAGDEDRQDRELPSDEDRLADGRRIITRLADECLGELDRLGDLFEISIDEVAWRKRHRYLTLVGDHRRRCVGWGCVSKR